MVGATPLQLNSRPRKLALLSTLLLVWGVYFLAALKELRAAEAASSSGLADLERSVRLEPRSAEYQNALGRMYAFQYQSSPPALEHLRKAAALNPNDARYWIDLAAAQRLLGTSDEDLPAIEHAVAADPTTPSVAWEAANIYLVQDDLDRALRYFRVVTENDERQRSLAFRLCWRVTHDPERMLSEVVPDTVPAYLEFLDILWQDGNERAAARVWDRIAALGKPIRPEASFGYLQFLLDHKDVKLAQRVWSNVVALSPALAGYSSTGQNLLVNGGFEEPVLNGGFDWRYQRVPSVLLGIDSGEHHSGNRSLRLTFSGSTPATAGIEQVFVVEPNRTYRFSGYVKSDSLVSASGPRFVIQDAYDAGQQFYLGGEWLGAHLWHEDSGEFTTGPGTHLAVLSIVRQPSDRLVRGRAWIDDLKVEAQ